MLYGYKDSAPFRDDSKINFGETFLKTNGNSTNKNWEIIIWTAENIRVAYADSTAPLEVGRAWCTTTNYIL